MLPFALLMTLSVSAPAADWSKLAFEEHDWLGAVQTVQADGAPSAAPLIRILMLEAAAAQLSDPKAGIPPEPKIHAGVLANHWEAWALSAAFDGAEPAVLGAALDRAIEQSRKVYKERQTPRIEATRKFLVEDLALPGALEVLLGGEGFPGANVLSDGMLPGTISGRVVLLAGNYRFKGKFTIPGDAELWIQRGGSLVPSGRDASIQVMGALRIFGAGDKPVVFGSSKDWLGIEYMSDMQHVLTNVEVRGADRGIDVKGSRLHLLDSLIENCGYGIYAYSYNIWLESVQLSDCSEAGFRQARPNGSSFFRDCSVRGNEVGILLEKEGVLRVWSTEFKHNATPVRCLPVSTTFLARYCNFLGKGALELHPDRPFDLRKNYWGAKNPNFSRRIHYSRNAKIGNTLLEPALKAATEAGVRPLD